MATACVPTPQENGAELGCPDIIALEEEAARIVGLVPPVDLASVSCYGVVMIDPDLRFGNPCDIVLRDAIGNESRHGLEIFSGSSLRPGRRLRVVSAPFVEPPPDGAPDVEKEVQILLGIWLTRTLSLDEIAVISTVGARCAEPNSAAQLAAPILRSLSEESGQIIEIIVCS